MSDYATIALLCWNSYCGAYFSYCAGHSHYLHLCSFHSCGWCSCLFESWASLWAAF